MAHVQTPSNLKKTEAKPEDDRDVEILKAVAQAWHSHSTSSTSASSDAEFDARRQFFRGKPSRFKIEAARSKKNAQTQYSWDFRQSLWDSYEIVSVSKKLETGLVIPNEGLLSIFQENAVAKRRKESKNSLRRLLNRNRY